jgi:hypothetical protein
MSNNVFTPLNRAHQFPSGRPRLNILPPTNRQSRDDNMSLTQCVPFAKTQLDDLKKNSTNVNSLLKIRTLKTQLENILTEIKTIEGHGMNFLKEENKKRQELILAETQKLREVNSVLEHPKLTNFTPTPKIGSITDSISTTSTESQTWAGIANAKAKDTVKPITNVTMNSTDSKPVTFIPVVSNTRDLESGVFSKIKNGKSTMYGLKFTIGSGHGAKTVTLNGDLVKIYSHNEEPYNTVPCKHMENCRDVACTYWHDPILNPKKNYHSMNFHESNLKVLQPNEWRNRNNWSRYLIAHSIDSIYEAKQMMRRGNIEHMERLVFHLLMCLLVVRGDIDVPKYQ